MTLDELNSLRGIDKEINDLKKRIEELNAAAEHCTPNVTTYVSVNPQTGKKEICVLPNAGSTGAKSDKVGNYGTEIVLEIDKLKSTYIKRQEEKIRLLDYIDRISDSILRQIFRYRFVDCLKWEIIAGKIGGENSSKNLSNMCYRYIAKS